MIPELVASAHGTVLELGPGTGGQFPRYDKSRVKHIYGVEPNKSMIPFLYDTAKQTGLTNVYTAVAAGIEDLETLRKCGLDEGSVDCVLSIQVLCSVPQPEKIAKALYRMLKPGGELVFYEHVISQDPVTRFMQGKLMR